MDVLGTVGMKRPGGAGSGVFVETHGSAGQFERPDYAARQAAEVRLTEIKQAVEAQAFDKDGFERPVKIKMRSGVVISVDKNTAANTIERGDATLVIEA